MNLKYHFMVIVGGLIISFHSIFVHDAYAYLDPNSASLVVQAMLGALIGVGITIKVFWEKIKYKLSSKLIKSEGKDLDSK